jgi:hypothetical protein
MENDMTEHKPRFTRDNTENYTAAELAVLNERFEDAIHLPADALAAMSDIERRSWEDHQAEQVLADLEPWWRNGRPPR